MKPATTDDVLDVMNGYFSSVALGAAMELGLFWLLEEQPLDATGVADRLMIPLKRCRYWLQLLSLIGLIERVADGYAPSLTARSAILAGYSRDSWALLAKEARERYPALCDLSQHIRERGSVCATLGEAPPMYETELAEDAAAARRFTRMLYELHQPLADEVTEALDLGGARRLMDLGGGSGVVSFALLRRYPDLTAVVVDTPNVCAVGREIAAENSLEGRVTYRGADFLRGGLPSGFDVVLECDVSVYSEALFHKVWGALNPDGRFVIVDQLAPAPGVAPPERVHWAFHRSLADPEFNYLTMAELEALLTDAGFRRVLDESLAPTRGANEQFTGGWTLIEAWKW
jgi:SAM-dependent methyltransferase